ncbi:hypothetical protein JMJ35_002902 [Cladonia borealis]|uniref:RAD52 homolog n=1 Tax=Cladonia borealis TaxID=184061 RepID=A0AA39R3S3_9LECA|nr:hypothetical protein JMJ35_002902 [Cladonia borealis]
MPEHGEQHKPAVTSVNPFEDVKPQISGYTAQEIATLSSRLEKQLGPEYISSRPGAGGGKVHYLSADKCINLANEVFGFNGWSSTIRNVQIDFVDENQTTGKVSLGLSVVVRVTLKDGTFHEDIGYGHIENCKGKAPAFEKAKKEGTTDGLKRALRNFGNLLGNCVYDKDYVARVTKLKIAPTKWDPDNLHRHPDFRPVKEEPLERSLSSHASLPQLRREWATDTHDSRATNFAGDPEDEFGSDDFDEVDFSVPQGDHPDEVTVDPSVPSAHFRRRNSLPNKGHPPSRAPGQTNPQRPRSPLAQNNSTRILPGPQTPVVPGNHSMAPPNSRGESSRATNNLQPPLQRPVLPKEENPSARPQQLQPPRPPPNPQPAPTHPSEPPSLHSSNPSSSDPPIGFFTARAAESLQSGPTSAIKAPAFNPHLESPSIRKTAGVDHTKTKPIGRELVGAPPPPPPVPRANFANNPQAIDKMRKVGMPISNASPLQNRGSYKPPQMMMKRPAEGGVGGRSALGDVTNLGVGVGGGGEGEKRQRVVGVEGGERDMLNI